MKYEELPPDVKEKVDKQNSKHQREKTVRAAVTVMTALTQSDLPIKDWIKVLDTARGWLNGKTKSKGGKQDEGNNKRQEV